MTYQRDTSSAIRTAPANAGPAGTSPASDVGVRLVGALLAVAVAAVHVTDQGGITRFAAPDWIGWSYRLIEAAGVLTALLLVVPRPADPRPRWLGWAVAITLGAGPFTAYVASRTVGLPGDPGDIGNWGYWVGTISLLVEAALVLLGVSVLWPHRRQSIRMAG